MMKLDLNNDSLQKEILTFNNNELSEEKSMGDKLEDFEIIMLLGKGAFGKVYKVRSKLNKKIYAMKMVDLSEIKNRDNEKKDGLRLALNETTFLNKLSHPHIIKYYKNFLDKDKLYIIIEYIKNGDIYELMKSRKEIKQPFTENELWNIFYQCITSLYYIHKKGVIHRDIKPKNIFLDENMSIKIGDFGISALNPNQIKEKNLDIKYSDGTYLFEDIDDYEKLLCHNTYVGTPNYMAKEILEKCEYDQKVDVASMGKTFYEMAYSLIDNKDNKKLNYSNKIDEIINLMRKDNKNERITSQEAYSKIEEEYLKISKNSSICAVISCLSSLNDLNKPLKAESTKYNDKSFISNYLKCINYIHDKIEDYKKWEDIINNFRKQLSFENLIFEGIKEIEPLFLFEFIIKKINEETINCIPLNPNYKDGPHLISINKENIIKNEEEAKIIYNNYLNKYDSLIIRNFMGLMKETNICSICKLKTYSFSSFFLANFDFGKELEKRYDAILDLEEALKEENIFNNIIYCHKCLQKVEHNSNKEYYNFPNYLVIYVKRGTSNNKIEINLKEIIELKDLEKNKDIKYKLVGFIKKINKDKEDIYHSTFFYNNQWLNCERNHKIIPCNPPFDKSKGDQQEQGEIIMLFYALKKKLVLSGIFGQK